MWSWNRITAPRTATTIPTGGHLIGFEKSHTVNLKKCIQGESFVSFFVDQCQTEQLLTTRDQSKRHSLFRWSIQYTSPGRVSSNSIHWNIEILETIFNTSFHNSEPTQCCFSPRPPVLPAGGGSARRGAGLSADYVKQPLGRNPGQHRVMLIHPANSVQQVNNHTATLAGYTNTNQPACQPTHQLTSPPTHQPTILVWLPKVYWNCFSAYFAASLIIVYLYSWYGHTDQPPLLLPAWLGFPRIWMNGKLFYR